LLSGQCAATGVADGNWIISSATHPSHVMSQASIPDLFCHQCKVHAVCRSGNASREPTAQTDANAEQMETNQQPLDDKAEGVDQNAAHQQGPMSSSPAIGITDDPSNAQLEPLTQAEKVTHDKLTDMDTDLAGEEASPSDDAAEPMETEAK